MTTEKLDLIARMREERNTAVQSKTICYVDESDLFKLISAIEVMREALAIYSLKHTEDCRRYAPAPEMCICDARDEAREALDRVNEILK
jgi:hypothetical protein